MLQQPHTRRIMHTYATATETGKSVVFADLFDPKAELSQWLRVMNIRQMGSAVQLLSVGRLEDGDAR